MRYRSVVPSITLTRRLLVAVAICGSVATTLPAVADDGTARAMLGLFGSALNQMQQQQQQQQPNVRPQPTQSRPIQWSNPKPKQAPPSTAEREQTEKVQAALKTLGFYTKPIDGVPGPSTTEAVKEWQQQVGQEPNGKLDSDELKMLFLAATEKQESHGNGSSPGTAVKGDDEPTAKSADRGKAAIDPDSEVAPQKRESPDTLKPKAEQGDADAQYQLGELYENGINVPQDDAEAVKWYEKAAAQGNGNAKERLSELKQRADELAAEKEEAEKKKAAEEKAAAERAERLASLPSCDSDKALEDLKKTYENGPDSKLVNSEFYEVEDAKEYETTDSSRTCLGIAVTNGGKAYIKYTFEQSQHHEGQYYIHMQEVSGGEYLLMEADRQSRTPEGQAAAKKRQEEMDRESQRVKKWNECMTRASNEYTERIRAGNAGRVQLGPSEVDVLNKKLLQDEAACNAARDAGATR